MKFFKLKRIIPLLIFVCIGIVSIVYFVGGLKAHYIDLDKQEFSDEGFTSFYTIQFDENGDTYRPELTYEKNRLVSENSRFAMYLDEETTIATVIDKTTGAVYTTAQDDTQSRLGANLLLNYAQVSNGREISSPINNMTNSVKFENTLTGDVDSFYKIKYIEDGVQILYEIGKFSANIDYFPMAFKKADFTKETMEDFEDGAEALKSNLNTFEGRFRGNTVFNVEHIENINPEGQRYYVVRYTGSGTTWSPAAAQYIEENNLATVEEVFGTNFWRLEDISLELLDSFGVHINAPNSPITSNPFINQRQFAHMFGDYNSINPKDTKQTKTDFLSDEEYYERPSTLTTSQQRKYYRYLYTEHEEVHIINPDRPVFYEDYTRPIRGGFHAVDQYGEFLYDEDNNPVRTIYSLEQTAMDNSLFGIESATSLERFRVGLQFKLTESGLTATILGDSLRDYNARKEDPNYDHNFLLDRITVLPQLTTTYNMSAEGMMIIPDGSGAIINFNNDKQLYSPINKPIYGRDMAFVNRIAPEDVETIMLNMYGYVDQTDNKGVLAIVEKGAAQTNIYADIPRGLEGNPNQRNTIYFTSRIRQREIVTAGAGWYTSNFPKWSNEMTKDDLQYKYIFLDPSELSYVGVANRYRDYLIDLYGLEEKDSTTTNLVDVNFLGAFERYDLFAGIRYKRDDSLTTFAQAQDIIQELKDLGVDNLSVGYKAWTEDGFEYEATRRLKPSKVLGRANGLLTLSQYLENEDILFFPELFVATSKGFDYSFGVPKYVAKGVGNDYAMHFPYNLATLMQERHLNPTYYLSSVYYQSIIEGFMPSYHEFNIRGAYVSDLGNMRLGDYQKQRIIFPGENTIYQMNTLELLSNELDYLKLSAPFDYALPYANIAVDVPLTSSLYGIFDATVPFYQLVVSGLLDYTTELVNGTSDRSVDWYFVKALETGSNLQFLLSYEDPKILLETDYTMFYKSHYENWRDIIVDMNYRINEVGIHQGRLVHHEVIDRDISKVVYEIPNADDLVLVINSSNRVYTYQGNPIDPYSFIKIEGGV